MLGIWRAGGIAVPLPVTAPGPELERALEDADAETVIVTPETVDRVVDGVPLTVEGGGSGESPC